MCFLASKIPHNFPKRTELINNCLIFKHERSLIDAKLYLIDSSPVDALDFAETLLNKIGIEKVFQSDLHECPNCSLFCSAVLSVKVSDATLITLDGPKKVKHIR